MDDWEIDIAQLQIDAKVASGAFSNLYRGSYCGQEVAVKILKDVQGMCDSQQMQSEAVRTCSDHEASSLDTAQRPGVHSTGTLPVHLCR